MSFGFPRVSFLQGGIETFVGYLEQQLREAGRAGGRGRYKKLERVLTVGRPVRRGREGQEEGDEEKMNLFRRMFGPGVVGTKGRREGGKEKKQKPGATKGKRAEKEVVEGGEGWKEKDAGEGGIEPPSSLLSYLMALEEEEEQGKVGGRKRGGGGGRNKESLPFPAATPAAARARSRISVRKSTLVLPVFRRDGFAISYLVLALPPSLGAAAVFPPSQQYQRRAASLSSCASLVSSSDYCRRRRR